MLRRLLSRVFRRGAPPPAPPVPKVGDTYRVADYEDARLRVAALCLESGRRVSARADWGSDGGTLTVTAID